ncbi:DUF6417 family protein [Streptomyces mirabilis]|uniref:DUF6417 family protein n=1 Tax=Streptomyces mirabilis TaxID=68239 RepID=UPI0036A01797
MITCLPRGASGRGCRSSGPFTDRPAVNPSPGVRSWESVLSVLEALCERGQAAGQGCTLDTELVPPPPVADGGAARVRRPQRPASGPSTDGLAEQVRTASCDHGIKRWRPYLTQEQVASVARGLWLHRMAGSAAEADRFACEYGVVHSPARGSGEGPPAARRGAGSSGRVWLAGRGRC